MSDADAPRIYPPRVREAAAPPPADDLLDGLNPAQRRAAAHGDGPLLVVAGAGTGKTRTLVHRVAHLVARGVPAQRILLLTFTRRASEEMLLRVERLIGAAGRQVQGGTFHGTAHRLLRRFGAQAGLAADFTILDQGDAEDLMQLSRGAVGLAEKKERFPKKETLHWVYTRHVNTEQPVADIVREHLPAFAEREGDFRRVYADYTARKAARNLVDYDDLLLFWAAVLEAPGLGARMAALYDHVLVDEYQDTNVLQARVLRGLAQAHRNVTAVGDDAQSIYSFRGATVRNILDFPRDFPGAAVVTLEQNYRSVAPILDATNALIAGSAERYDKTLFASREGGERAWLVACRDEAQQTRFVVDRILELHEHEGLALRDVAVLFRAGYMSADLEVELTARSIPYEKWGGLKFLEAAHVKDVLAFLRVLENPRDEVSWYRLLQLLPGIGDVTARRAVDHLGAHDWQAAALAGWAAPPRARLAHQSLASLIGDLASGADRARPLPDEIARVRRLYDGILRERYDRPEPRIADLDQLQNISAGYPDRGAFLSALALEPPSATQDLAGGRRDADDDALVLSTVHSAKGKEWGAVFVIWAADGWFPLARSAGDDDELEEERRLMYVALTRARDHLAVCYPLQSYGARWGADFSLDQLSRFITPAVREHMQRVVVGEPAPQAPEPAAAPAVDLRALLRGRFGG